MTFIDALPMLFLKLLALIGTGIIMYGQTEGLDAVKHAEYLRGYALGIGLTIFLHLPLDLLKRRMPWTRN